MKQLQAIDLAKIENKDLRSSIASIIEEYNTTEAQEMFEEVAAENIKTLYKLVESKFPEAIPGTTKSATPAPKKSEPQKAKDEQEIEKKIKEIDQRVEKCKATIREYNKKKREGQDPKPKKSRYTLLKDRLVSIIGLIPEKLADDFDVLSKTERILKKTHADLIDAWQMSETKASSGVKAIEEKFDELDEKRLKIERKEQSQKWKDHIKQLKKDDIQDDAWKALEEAVKSFSNDPSKSKSLLEKQFKAEQIKAILPEYIYDVISKIK